MKDSYKLVFEMDSTLELTLDAAIVGSQIYFGVLDTRTYGIDIVKDSIYVSDRINGFVDDLNTRVSYLMQEIDTEYFKDGIDMPKWFPDYVNVDTYYYDGAVLAEIDFEDNNRRRS